jgi:hypothetical protein
MHAGSSGMVPDLRRARKWRSKLIEAGDAIWMEHTVRSSILTAGRISADVGKCSTFNRNGKRRICMVEAEGRVLAQASDFYSGAITAGCWLGNLGTYSTVLYGAYGALGARLR